MSSPLTQSAAIESPSVESVQTKAAPIESATVAPATAGATASPSIAEPLIPEADEDAIPIPDISHLVTEDDTPVDNLIQEKLQRFLVECLYSSLKLGIPFLAAADLGLFYGLAEEHSLAPDVLLSLGVAVPEDWSEQRKRSYFVWEFGKPPDVAIEIVSNKKGGELDTKLEKYARVGIPYYVVFDPLEQLSPQILQVYGLHEGRYRRLPGAWLESVGLGLTVWAGEFEGKYYHRWLRWCDREGNLLLTGDEKARQESQRAEQERQRAEQERQRAEQAEQQIAQERQHTEQERQRAEQECQRAEQERLRAEQLAELLRRHGLSPGESQNITSNE